MTELYTSSRIRALRACLRLHQYQYQLGLAGAESRAMRFGTVAHLALEAWYQAWKQGRDDERLAVALAVVDASELDAVDRVRLRALLVVYHARWHGEPWRVLAVEVEFRYELGGHAIGGKIDAVVQDLRDDRIYVVEHKTTTADVTPGAPYWERLAIDTQVSIYTDGALMLGYPIAGVIYDVMSRPRHERRMATPESQRKFTKGKGCKACGGSWSGQQGNGLSTATTHGGCGACKGTGWRLDASGEPEAPRLYSGQRADDESIEAFEQRVQASIFDDPMSFLNRATVVRLEDELPKMRDDLLDSIKLERITTAINLAPRNTDACLRYGSLCPYFDLCASRADVDDEVRFPRVGPHRELSNII